MSMLNLQKQESNPITGQHVELTIQPSVSHELDMAKLKVFLKKKLPKYMMPKRIKIATVPLS